MSAGIHYFANHTPVGILGLSQVYAMLRGRAFYAAAGKVVPAYRQRQASIRIFNPQKKHSPLHMKDFYAWFSEDSSVKALISKCSPPLWRFCRFSADFQWLSGVKAWYFNPSQAFTARCECFVNAFLPMWTLWIQSLHTWKRWKSEENEHCVNGWILFSGNKLRIYARVKRAFTKQISALSFGGYER